MYAINQFWKSRVNTDAPLWGFRVFGDLAGRDSQTNLLEGFPLLSTCPVVLRACLESTVASEKLRMLPQIPFNHVLTLFYLQNITPGGQDLLQIRSYVYAEEPNIDIHNFVGTFTRVSKPHGGCMTGVRAHFPVPAGLYRGVALCDGEVMSPSEDSTLKTAQ